MENNQFQSNFDFEKYFPKLINSIQNYSKLLDIEGIQNKCSDQTISQRNREKQYHNFLKKIQKVIFPIIDEEIIPLIPQWKDLQIIQDGNVCTHILNVLYLVTINDDYLKMTEEEQNYLKWAALLHDILKRGPPMFCGKDHVHPFMGGLATLEIFKSLKFIIVTKENEFYYEKLFTLICNSVQEVSQQWADLFKPNQLYCKVMHSHHNLYQIFNILWSHFAKKGSFVDIVFRLVMFHQSLPGIKDIPPIVCLTDSERFCYCDPQLLKLIKILMINDSYSYTFIIDFDQKTQIFRKEIIQSIEQMIKEWQEMYAVWNNNEL